MPSTPNHPLLETLDEQLTLHDPSLAAIGGRHVARIAELYWSSETRRVSCTLPAEDDSFRIELDLPFAIGDPLAVGFSPRALRVLAR